MSTTGPVIWITWPVAAGAGAVLAIGGMPPGSRSAGLGAGRDLDHLAGDVGLTDLVVFEGQVVDQLLGVLGRVLHRDHLAREEARRGLQGGLVEPRRDIAREEPLQDRRRVRLEDELVAGNAGGVLVRRDRQQLD